MPEMDPRILERLRQVETQKRIKEYTSPPKASQGAEGELAVYPKSGGTGFAVKFKGKWREVGVAAGGGDPGLAYSPSYPQQSSSDHDGPGWGEIERLDLLIREVVDRINALHAEDFEITPRALGFGNVDPFQEQEDVPQLTVSIKNWTDQEVDLDLRVRVSEDGAGSTKYEFAVDPTSPTWVTSVSNQSLKPMDWADGVPLTVLVRPVIENMTVEADNPAVLDLDFDVDGGSTELYGTAVNLECHMGLGADFGITPFKILNLTGVVGATVDGWSLDDSTKAITLKNDSTTAPVSGIMTIHDHYIKANGDYQVGPWMSVFKSDRTSINYRLVSGDASLAVVDSRDATDTTQDSQISWTLDPSTEIRIFPRCLPVAEGIGDGGLLNDNTLYISPGFSSPYDDYKVHMNATGAALISTDAHDHNYGVVPADSSTNPKYRCTIRNRSTSGNVSVRIQFDDTYSGNDHTFFEHASQTPDMTSLGWNGPDGDGDYTITLGPKYAIGDGVGNPSADAYVDAIFQFDPDESHSYLEAEFRIYARTGNTPPTHNDGGGNAQFSGEWELSGTGVADGAVFVFDGAYNWDSGGDAHVDAKIDFTSITDDAEMAWTITNVGSSLGPCYVEIPSYVDFRIANAVLVDGSGAQTNPTVTTSGGDEYVDLAGHSPAGIPAGGKLILTLLGDYSAMTDGVNSFDLGVYITNGKTDKLCDLTMYANKVTGGLDGADGADGAAGTDARAVNLTMADQTFEYDLAGATPSPANAVVTATAMNTTGTVYYEFYLNDVLAQASSTTATYTYTPPATYADMPEKIEVQIAEDISGSPILARDQITASGLLAGSSAITTVLTNEAHTLPTTNQGVVTYTGSGTDIEVWIGTTQLTYAASGDSTFAVSAVGTNITVGSASTVGSARRYADHSAMTADYASIAYTITVTDSISREVVLTRTQSFSKSWEGSDGSGDAFLVWEYWATGGSGDTVYYRQTAGDNHYYLFECVSDHTSEVGEEPSNDSSEAPTTYWEFAGDYGATPPTGIYDPWAATTAYSQFGNWLPISNIEFGVLRAKPAGLTANTMTMPDDTADWDDIRIRNIGSQATGATALSVLTVTDPPGTGYSRAGGSPSVTLSVAGEIGDFVRGYSIKATAPTWNDTNFPGGSEITMLGSAGWTNQPTGNITLSCRVGRYWEFANLDPLSPTISMGQVARGSSNRVRIPVRNVGDEPIEFLMRILGTRPTGVSDWPVLYLTYPDGTEWNIPNGTYTGTAIPAGETYIWEIVLAPDFDDREVPLDFWALDDYTAIVIQTIWDTDPGHGSEQYGSLVYVKGSIGSDVFWARPVHSMKDMGDQRFEATGVQYFDMQNFSDEVHTFEPSIDGSLLGGYLADSTAMVVSPGGVYSVYVRPACAWEMMEYYVDNSAELPAEEGFNPADGNWTPLNARQENNLVTVRGNSGSLPAILRSSFEDDWGDNPDLVLTCPNQNDMGIVQTENFQDAWKHRVLVGVHNVAYGSTAFTLRCSSWTYSLPYLPYANYFPVRFYNVHQTTDNAPNLGWATYTGTENNPSSWFSGGATALWTSPSLPQHKIAYVWMVPYIAQATYNALTGTGKSFYGSVGAHYGLTMKDAVSIVAKYTSRAGTPAGQVLYPVSEALLTQNTNREITWTYNGPTTHVDIYLLEDANEGAIVEGILNTGSYYWESIAKTHASQSYDSTGFTIEIRAAGGSLLNGCTSDEFTLGSS
jgi:hypothetical protein